MTIEKSGHEAFTVCCDHCSESEDFDGDFLDVIIQMKDAGWKITNTDGDFDHMCPDCVEKENEELDEEI